MLDGNGSDEFKSIEKVFSNITCDVRISVQVASKQANTKNHHLASEMK
jgi:ssRNA-specific RNase YbeY (16S rRNA maturation enzyme)